MPPNANLEQLIAVARLLRPMLDEIVFVGGSVTGILITDPAAGEPRATRDVDVIAAIKSLSAYYKFGDRIRSQGFSEDKGGCATLPVGASLADRLIRART